MQMMKRQKAEYVYVHVCVSVCADHIKTGKCFLGSQSQKLDIFLLVALYTRRLHDFLFPPQSLIVRKGSPNTSISTKAVSSLSGGLDFCLGLHSGKTTTLYFGEPDLEF